MIAKAETAMGIMTAQRRRKKARGKQGRMRPVTMTPEERQAVARHAAEVRWAKVRKAKDEESARIADLIMGEL